MPSFILNEKGVATRLGQANAKPHYFLISSNKNKTIPKLGPRDRDVRAHLHISDVEYFKAHGVPKSIGEILSMTFNRTPPQPVENKATNPTPSSGGENETTEKRNQSWYLEFKDMEKQSPKPTNEAIFKKISKDHYGHDGKLETVKSAVNGIRRGKGETNRHARPGNF